jgi:Flp pilus assembly protein TadD
MERFADAEPLIARATSINQTSPASFNNYGLISKRLNKLQQALVKFTEALTLDPSGAETWNN